MNANIAHVSMDHVMTRLMDTIAAVTMDMKEKTALKVSFLYKVCLANYGFNCIKLVGFKLITVMNYMLRFPMFSNVNIYSKQQKCIL